MNLRHGLFVIAIIFSTLLALVLISCDVEAEETILHLNMKRGRKLHPVTLGDPDALPRELVVEADYDEIPIIGTRYNKRWVTVGNWNAEEREIPFIWDRGLGFNLWYKINQEGYDAEPQFRLTFFTNNSSPGVEADGDDHDNDDILMIDLFGNFLNETIYENDTLRMRVQYSGYEDCTIYFDNATYDSGLSLNADFLRVFNMSARDREVSLEVYDAFGTDWEQIRNYSELSIDTEPPVIEGILISDGAPLDINGTLVNRTLITWKLGETLRGGELVEGWIKYTPIGRHDHSGIHRNVTAATGEGNLEPIARIRSIDPNPAVQGEEVTFDASDSYDEDGVIVRYEWKSDLDGMLYDDSEPVFSREDLSLGTHNITLRVKDDDGYWGENALQQLEIREQSNTPPEIQLTSPENGEILYYEDVTLYWSGDDEDGDDLVFDVYMDTDPDPTEVVSEERSEQSYHLTDLLDGETYYWKVVVSDGTDQQESDIWSFRVEMAPINSKPTITLISPQNGSVLYTDSIQLIWRGEDDDDDVLTYRVYMGIDVSNLSVISENQSVQYYQMSGLIQGMNYFWRVVVSDGTDEVESDTYNFTFTTTEGKDDDDDFEIAGVDGFIVIGAVVAVVVVVISAGFMMTRRSNYWEDYEYDEYGYNEYGYDEQGYDEQGYDEGEEWSD